MASLGGRSVQQSGLQHCVLPLSVKIDVDLQRVLTPTCGQVTEPGHRARSPSQVTEPSSVQWLAKATKSTLFIGEIQQSLRVHFGPFCAEQLVSLPEHLSIN